MEIQCGPTLDGDVLLALVKSGYILGGYTPILGDHNSDGNYINREGKNRKWVQQVSEQWILKLAKLVK